MDSEAKRRSVRKEEDNESNEVCSCLCQKDISSIRAEVSAIRKLLDNNCAGKNSVKPESSNVSLEHESNEVQKQDSDRVGDDVETDGSSEGSAASIALLNDLVLRHLGSYLPVWDLLECRLVCQAWNFALSVTLRTRSTYLKKKMKDVSRLISSVQKNPKLFPFPGCQLSDSMFNGKPEKPMKKFLRNYNHVFKRLRIPYSDESFQSSLRLAKFLKTYFSHVEVIDMTNLNCQSDKWTPTELGLLSSELEQLCLPELQKLILPFDIRPNAGMQVFVTGLIKAAPNLQHIEDFVPALANALISSGKMDLISTMCFVPCVVAVPCIQLALTPSCKVSHLEIGDIMEWTSNAGLQLAIRNAFVGVLIANRETLKSLTMNGLGSEIKDFPVLPKLLNLHIRGDEEKCPDTYRMFPENVSNVFPALKAVTIQLRKAENNFRGGVQDEILRKFLWDEPSLSVTSLKVHCAIDKEGIEFLGTMFPSITNLWIDWEACFGTDSSKFRRDDLWDVWTVPFKLRRLEINAFNPWTNSDFSLDSFLTGISERLCHNLRQERYAHLPMDPCYYDALRGYPSMLNLKDSLSELVITIDYPGTQASQSIMERSLELGHPVRSSVSTFYGIRLMKAAMCVYLAYDHRKFYSSNFRNFLAPIEGGSVILCHAALADPPGHSGISVAF